MSVSSAQTHTTQRTTVPVRASLPSAAIISELGQSAAAISAALGHLAEALSLLPLVFVNLAADPTPVDPQPGRPAASPSSRPASLQPDDTIVVNAVAVPADTILCPAPSAPAQPVLAGVGGAGEGGPSLAGQPVGL